MLNPPGLSGEPLEVVGEIDRRYASGHLIYDPSFIRLVLEGTRCIDRGYQ